MMRFLIVCDRAQRAAAIRARPLHSFLGMAVTVHDSDPLMSVYAAPEWQELHADGKLWVQALVRETIALAVERIL